MTVGRGVSLAGGRAGVALFGEPVSSSLPVAFVEDGRP
jgi:hypothetical protein